MLATDDGQTGDSGRLAVCPVPGLVPILLPLNGGNRCIGNTAESKTCKKRDCPVAGHWTDWTMWYGCSVTCGSGHKTRQRYYSNPAPSNGGATCTGTSTEQVECNGMGCPGLSTRHRNCSNPPPSPGGQECIGDSTMQRLCHQTHCLERHAVPVFRSSVVTCNGYDFLALEVLVPQDGQSRSPNWCHDYKYLCEDFSRIATGCGHNYINTAGYSDCRVKYNSDMNIGGAFGCNPSSGVAAVTKIAFPDLRLPPHGGNAFGFVNCDNCSKTLRGRGNSLWYVQGFWKSNMTTFYTSSR